MRRSCITAPCRGKLSHRRQGVWTAPDYKTMYFELFRASVQAAQLLQDAQKRAEQQLLDADLPPIRLGQPEKKDEE